jgi:hypothetical protein
MVNAERNAEIDETNKHASGVVPPLLRNTRRHAPLRRRRARQMAAGYSVTWIAGVATLALASSQAAKATLLGLMLPGSGWVYAGHWPFAVLAVLLFVVSLPMHPIVTGAVWVGTALGAAAHFHGAPVDSLETVVPIVTFGLAALVALKSTRTHRKLLAERRESSTVINGRPSISSRVEATIETPPLSDAGIAELEFILDLALQPIDEWAGFTPTKIETTLASLRYQLAWSQVALAMHSFSRAPAFTGYLEEAQRNLNQKMTERRVWSYWKWENALGNLDLDGDPIRRDNIMYSGYFGAMLGLYEASTGQNNFREPGSLRLHRDANNVYDYDTKRLNDALGRNFSSNSHCLFACEPHLIYPVCNGFGIASVVLEQNLHGSMDDSDYQRLLDTYRDRLAEEFTTVDGRYEGWINTSWALPMLHGDVNDATVGFLHHAIDAPLAERNWEMLRYWGLERTNSSRFELRGIPLDFGRRRRDRLAALCCVAMDAAEMGDVEACDVLFEEIDELTATTLEQTGSIGVSHWARLNGAIARLVRPGAFRDMVNLETQPGPPPGPRLAAASYPEVIVCGAIQANGGIVADLAPGTGSYGPRRLRYEGMRPNAVHHLRSGVDERAVRTDAVGSVTVDVDLPTRSRVVLTPEGA